jgi:hypothetical protein
LVRLIQGYGSNRPASPSRYVCRSSTRSLCHTFPVTFTCRDRDWLLGSSAANSLHGCFEKGGVIAVRMGNPKLLLLHEPSLRLSPLFVDQILAATRCCAQWAHDLVGWVKYGSGVEDLRSWLRDRDARVAFADEAAARLSDPKVKNAYLAPSSLFSSNLTSGRGAQGPLLAQSGPSTIGDPSRSI